MKKKIGLLLVACLILVVPPAVPVHAQDPVSFVWQMVEIVDQKNEEGWALYEVGPYWFFEKIYERGNFYAKVSHTDDTTYFAYSTRAEWSQPPAVIRPGEKVTLQLKMYEIENTHKWNTSGSSANADFAPVGLGLGSRGYDLFSNASGTVDIALNGAAVSRVEETMTATAPLAGYNGEKRIALRVGYYHGTSMGTYYIYELQPYDPGLAAQNKGDTFLFGARLMWQASNGIGYRLYRSQNPNELGVSVTDFHLTSRSFADVNVQPGMTFYYTVKPVLAEARPLQGISEQLGPTIATFTVKTVNSASAGPFKHFIMMQMDNPDMTFDGERREVDPGRGTVPMILSNRTMVPIRAVVESMGGTLGWDAVTKKITLTARGNVVEMWIGKNDLRINGTLMTMDVAPVIRNSRTYVPVRFAAENLNASVDWINSTKEAVIVFED